MAKAGRPTDFHDDIPQMVLEYLGKEDVVIHSKAGLCVHLECSEGALNNWLKLPTDTENLIYENDSVLQLVRLISQLEMIQRRDLIEKGLTGDFNATITKVLLAKHGISEKIETEHSGTITTETYELSDTERSQRIAALLERGRARRTGSTDN